MPTICVVVGCHNRHSKQCGLQFYRFPTDKDCRQLWIAFVSRRNPDGSAWQPGSGDRVCSDHFVSRKKSDLPGLPDFVPSIQTKMLELSLSHSENSYCHFGMQDAVPECKNKVVRNQKRIDRQLN